MLNDIIFDELSSARHFSLQRRKTSTVDRAYALLKERIIFFDLKPDTVLDRNELCQEIGISLTPLREALQRLQEEELVEIIPQSKTYVTRIDSKKLQSAHFLRVSLESEVVRRLTKSPSQELVGALKVIIDKQKALINTPELVNKFHALDELFHYTMFATVGQSELHRMLITKLSNLARLRRLELPNKGKMEWVVKSHSNIVEAISSGNAGQAIPALRTDISGSISKIESLKNQHPEYFY